MATIIKIVSFLVQETDQDLNFSEKSEKLFKELEILTLKHSLKKPLIGSFKPIMCTAAYSETEYELEPLFISKNSKMMFDFSDITGFFARRNTLQFGFCFIGESDNNSESLISDVQNTVKDAFFGKISELKRSETKYHGDDKDVIDYIYQNPYISKIVERFGNETYVTLS